LIGRVSTAEETINKLNGQLEELINAKSEHESQLISKFVQLLNEKKLKIRNQQRLLASARVDPSKSKFWPVWTFSLSKSLANAETIV
jgi:DNA double-strand break repair and V(D)J recombination protein XRCC4